MPKWSLACLGLVVLVLGIFESLVLAEAALPLPACQVSHQGHIYPSPTVAQDNILFAAGEWALQDYIHYLYRSTDRGHTWERLPDLPFTEPYRARIDLSPNFAMDQTLSVTFRTATNISHDGGFTWRVVALPQATPNTFALGDAQHLFAGYIPTGLVVDELAVSPDFVRDRTLLMSLGAYHYNGGLWKSTDAGLTWARADTGIYLGGMGLSSLRFSPQYASDRTLFCVNFSSYKPTVYKSVDAGVTWALQGDSLVEVGGSVPQLLLSPRYAQDQTLWLVDYERSSVSRDGGQTWQPATAYPLRLHAAAEYCLPSGVCSVELFGELYEKHLAGTQGQYYLYRSYDYGATWQCLEDPTPPPGSVPAPPPAEIPEPATWLLLAGGAAALAGWRRRPHRAAESRPGAGQWRGAH
ncbi:MAG: BNR/Asp-box repeat protein [Chloroflexi bacterium ADurb.Bin325]|nr:MAG: BNR/Asp-box repeat protein [Chloroflexi bacterium ADurb.Bin325]